MQDFSTLGSGRSATMPLQPLGLPTYEQRINEIATLEASANGRPRRAIPGMMTNALPLAPFTLDALVASLKEKHPKTVWNRVSVMVFLQRMHRDGFVKRLTDLPETVPPST